MNISIDVGRNLTGDIQVSPEFQPNYHGRGFHLYLFFVLIIGKYISLTRFKSTWKLISQIFWLQIIDHHLFRIKFE